MAYATVTQFEALFREAILGQFMAGIPDRQAQIRRWLDTSSAEIDAALQAAGYPSPLLEIHIASDQRVQTLTAIATHASALAGELMMAGVNDIPAGPKAIIASSKKWAELLRTGKIMIPGVDRVSSEISSRASGSVSFIPLDDANNFPRGHHAALRRIV